MLEVLKEKNVESHLLLTKWASKCLTLETQHTPDYVKSLATTFSDDENMAASVSSGTHKTDGMIIIPCSMKTLSSIANGYDETLVARAASFCWCWIPHQHQSVRCQISLGWPCPFKLLLIIILDKN